LSQKEDKMARTTVRYSICFKRSIVEAIEKDGLSIEACRRRWNIKGTMTIQNWLRQFGKNHLLNKVVMVQTLNERDELLRLRKELQSLKIAYADLAMEHRIDQKVMELADEQYGLDLKKKYEQALSQRLKGSSK
jgi:transposase-like protein